MRKAKRILALLLVFTLMFSNIGTTMIYATDIQNEPAVSQETEASPAVEPAEAEPSVAEPSTEPTPAEPAAEEEPSEEPTAPAAEEEPPAGEPAATVPAADPQPADEDAVVNSISPEPQPQFYATYQFYINDVLVDTQVVANGECLREPASSGQVFQGWKIEGEEGYINFKEPVVLTETVEEPIRVDAEVKATSYAVFYGEDGQVVDVQYGDAGDPVDLSVKIDLKRANTALKGWATEKNGRPLESAPVLPEGEKPLELFPVVVAAYWVTFLSNGGSKVAPVYVEEGELVEKPEDPTKDGYDFVGWFKEDGTEFDFSQPVAASTKLTAKWELKQDITYTVVYWYQAITDDKSWTGDQKTYDYAGTDTTERNATRNDIGKKPSSEERGTTPVGFTYNNDKSGLVETSDGKFVLNVYFDRKTISYTFEYEEGWGWNKKKITEVWTGLYGQPFSKYGYEWMTEFAWDYSGGGMTYMSEFLSPNGDAANITFEASSHGYWTGNVTFHRQDLNGNYDDGVTVKKSYGSGFNVTEKYSGYSAKHYSLDDGKTIRDIETESDKSLAASDTTHVYFDLNTYNLDFYSNGRKLESKSRTPKYTEPLSQYEPEDWVEGETTYGDYTFDGWYVDSTFQQKADFDKLTMPASNMALYAKWVIKEVKVTFKQNVTAEGADTTFETASTDAGTTVKEPQTDPTRAGYTFAGWVDENGDPFNFDNPITDDITLYAKWIKNGTLNIVYDAGNSEGQAPVDTKKYVDGGHAIIQSGEGLTNDEGGKFRCWTIEETDFEIPSGAVVEVQARYAENDTITLTAVYADSAVKVDVTYYANYPPDAKGVSEAENQTEQWRLGNWFHVKANTFPEPSNYKFIGWSTASEGDVEYKAGGWARIDSENGNNLYAVWERSAYNIHYVAVGSGNVLPETETVSVGNKLTGSTPTADEGSCFVGWFTDEACTKPIAGELSDITPTADTTYYAKFAPKTVITLTVEDITYNEVYTGEPITKTAPIKVSMSEEANIEYTLSCDGDVVANEGTNDFTISKTPVGRYTGTVTVEVTNCPDGYTYQFANNKNIAEIVLNITPAAVTVGTLPNVEYNGAEQKQEPVVKFGNTTLTEEDYAVTWDAENFTNVGAKTATIKLSNSNYTFADSSTTAEVSYEITQRPLTIKAGSAEQNYNGKPLTCETWEVVGRGPVDDHEVKASTKGSRTFVGHGDNEIDTVQILDIDNNDVTDNYKITRQKGTLTVNATELIVTADNAEKVYDGQPWDPADGSYTYNKSLLAEGDELVVTLAGPTDVDAGTYPGAIQVTAVKVMHDGDDVTANYTFGTHVAGDLEITKRPVSFYKEDTKTYDGSEQTLVFNDLTGYVVDAGANTGLVEGHTASANAVIKGTTKGEYKDLVGEKVVIKNGDKIVTGNYEVSVDGKLTIEAIPDPITITVESAEQQYNGHPLFSTNFTYTEGVLLGNDRLEVTLDGSQTDAGTGERTVKSYRVMHGETDVTNCYTFEDSVPGTLTVTQFPLHLSGSYGPVKYSGNPYSVELEKPTTLSLPDNHELDADSVTITQKDVGIYVTGNPAEGETAVTLTPKITKNGKDVTGNFYITLEGRLEITKPVKDDYTVSVDKAGWVYDGETGGPVSTTFTNKNTGGGASGFQSRKITYQKIVSAGNVEELGTTAPTEAGKYIVCATWVPTAENTNNLPTLTATKEFEIQKRPVTFNKIMETDYRYDPDTYEGISQEFVLDTTEEPLTEAIAAGSFANNRTTASTTAVIEGTNVGEHKLEDAAGKVVITDAGKDVTSNYAITFEPVLRINPVDRPEEKRALEVQSYNKPYDADAHTIDHNFEAIELPDDALEFLGADGQWTTTKRSYTDVTNGEQTVQIRVTNPNFNPVSNAATVRITPFKVRVTAPKVEIEYGQTLPAASELRATIVTQTIPGNPAITSSVSYDMRELGGTKPAAKTYLGVVNVFATAFSENYEFELVSGDVIVRQKGARTIAVTGYEGTYNGQPHSVTVSFPNGDGEPTDKVYYRVAGEEEWTTEELTFTDVVDTTVEVKVVNPNFAVDSTGTARIQISPATLNVETYGATKTYDGSPLTAGGRMTGLVGEETATLRVTGSVTDATGSEGVPNTYEIDWGTAKESNYTIHEDSVGRLIVNRQTIEKGFTVAGVASPTYDGEEHVAAPGVSKTNGDLLEKGTDYTLTYTDDAEKTVTDFTNVTGLIHVTVTGKGNYTGSVTRTYQIIPKQLTVTSESASKVYDGTKLTAPGHVSGFVPGEEVGFTTPELVNVDYSNDDHSIVNEVTIQWNDTTKASNYTYTPDYGTLTVTPRTLDEEGTDFEVSEPRSSVYDGAEHQERLAVTYKDQPLVLGKDYTETYTDARGRVVTNFTDVTGPINVTITGTGNFAGTVRKQYQITPAPLTITTEGGVKVYDGTALTVDGYTVDGLKNNEALDLTITGTQTIAGSSDNTYTIDWNASSAKQGNYAITNELGRLQVEAQSIDPQVPGRYSGVTVSQPDDTVYNGGAQRRSVTVTDANGDALVPGLDYTVTYSDNVTDAGTVTVTVTGIGSYSGTVTRTYRIAPKELTVTTASAEKVYDGTAMTRTNGYTLSGLVIGENVSVQITGSQTAVGSSDNTYSINWGRVNEQNYTITEDLGTLTVTAQSIDPDAGDDEYMGVTVGTLGNVVYNGLAQAVRPRVANAAGRALMSGVDYTITFSADTTNVGEVTATVTGIGNYAGTVTRTYRITPAPLTVNTESATIVFNGGALTAGGRVTGLVNGETVTLNTTGSQTFVGFSENTYEIVWDNARSSNYEIVSETLGTLTVLAAPAAPAAPDAPAPAAADDPAPVAPETDPEPAPEPTPEAENEPEEIEENSVPLAPNTEPEVETIDDNATPLAPGTETHECCILHFLLLLLALCVEIYYTHDRKKRQKHIYELRSEIGNEE